MIRTNCRSSFQTADFDFLVSSLRRDSSSSSVVPAAEVLAELLRDGRQLADRLVSLEPYGWSQL